MYIAIINGPNLNLIGVREPSVYGNTTFEEYLNELKQTDFPTHIDRIEYYQSNIEGELVTAIQQHGMHAECMGIVLNAGAYSHTSIAIADAIAAVKADTISVHISNIYSRETERHTDLLLAKCKGSICGLGLEGYRLAILALINHKR